MKFTRLFKRLFRSDGGQDLVEYALLAAIVALAGMVALRAIETATGTTYVSWETSTQDLWIMPAPGAGGP